MGKKTTKTSQTTSLPSWAQPLATGAGNQILNTVSGNQGNLQSIASGIQSHLGQLGSQAFGQQPGVAGGQSFISKTLGGSYLNSNPYTQAIMKQAGQDAGNAVNSTFGLAGRTGGGANQELLAKGISQAENQVGFQNYQNERGLQNQALGAIPGLVQSQYAGVLPYVAAANAAGTLPYAGIQNLGQIGNLYGGAGTTTQKQPGGWGTALLGGLLGL